MNQRIKELALQAGIKYGSVVDYFYSPATDGITRQDMEKFADLIVQEMCSMMEQCEDDVYHCYEPGEQSNYTAWLYDWQTRFKEHFGVKE